MNCAKLAKRSIAILDGSEVTARGTLSILAVISSRRGVSSAQRNVKGVLPLFRHAFGIDIRVPEH